MITITLDQAIETQFTEEEKLLVQMRTIPIPYRAYLSSLWLLCFDTMSEYYLEGQRVFKCHPFPGDSVHVVRHNGRIIELGRETRVADLFEEYRYDIPSMV